MADTGKQSATMDTTTKVHTYHCICTQLILATTTPTTDLTKRTSDSSLILPLPSTQSSSHDAILKATNLDPKPTMIRREDGFEKRYMHRCSRCDTVVGYQLDKSQWLETKGDSGRREGVLYLLRGGLMETVDMQSGKDMRAESGLVTATG
ncbi:hypothetical protein MBLNU457_6446t1 [Dothideomycetes sp. NU457]